MCYIKKQVFKKSQPRNENHVLNSCKKMNDVRMFWIALIYDLGSVNRALIIHKGMC